MILPKQQPSILSPSLPPLLYAERSFTGYGQERGGVQTILKNPSSTDSVDFVYLESLPWFMKPYLHTLTARLDSDNTTRADSNRPGAEYIKEMYYRPALDRQRGTHLEVRMTVPRNSTVLLTYDFEKAILRYTEYPPDANRGFDIAPAIIGILAPRVNFTSSSQAQDHEQRKVISYLRTTSLLLYLPTPDFSMPYNVIILTSTVIALAFGTVFNILVRKFVLKSKAPTLGAKIRSLAAKIKTRIVGAKGDGEEK